MTYKCCHLNSLSKSMTSEDSLCQVNVLSKKIHYLVKDSIKAKHSSHTRGIDVILILA